MKHTILIVDDMPIFRDPIAASLCLAGFEALRASSGKEALAVVSSRRPNLILLDVAMPEMDGLTFLKHLRAEKEWAAIPVILLTAIAEKRYIQKAGELGASEYLLKSRFRLKDLLERIHKHLGPSQPSQPQGPTPAAAAAPAKRETATPNPTAAAG